MFQAYENVVAAAGYSVGEFAALVASGTMTFDDGKNYYLFKLETTSFKN